MPFVGCPEVLDVIRRDRAWDDASTVNSEWSLWFSEDVTRGEVKMSDPSAGRTGQARTSAASAAISKKRKDMRDFSSRMAAAQAQRASTSSPASDQSDYSDAQQAMHEQLSRASHKLQRQRSRTPPSRLGFEPIAVAEPEGYEEATGCNDQ